MKYLNSCPKLSSILLLFIAFCLSSCETDVEFAPSSTTITGPPNLTTRVVVPMISGFVTGTTDDPVQSATVVVGNVTTNTDQFGYFEVRNVSVVQDAALVAITSQNYFQTIKTFIAEEGKEKFLRIKLIPKTQVGTIDASQGGSTILSNGLTIKLPAAAVVNAATNGQYNGTIRLYASLLDATDPDLVRIMPGDLRGVNTGNAMRLLSTYGMAAVELRGANDELLQIAAGKKATLIFPIAASLQSSAPTTIPLWYFDEHSGLWMEQGSAMKAGNTFIGEVSHFSFWNCDLPGSYVQFNCTFVESHGTAIDNLLIKLIVVNNPSNWSTGYTNSQGYVSGPVPANAQVRMEVFSNSGPCSNPLYTQTFTTTNINLSSTIIINTPSSTATVTGTVSNCNNAALDSGRIIMGVGNQYFVHHFTHGSYQFNLLICNTQTISLRAVDLNHNQISTIAGFTLHAGNNTISDLRACGQGFSEFIHFTIGNLTYDLTTANSQFRQYYLTFTNGGVSTVVDLLQGTYFSATTPTIWIYIDRPFSFPVSSSKLEYFNPTNAFGEADFRIPNPITAQLTEYGSVGQYIAGSFSGIVKGVTSNNLYPVNCSFKVVRSQ